MPDQPVAVYVHTPFCLSKCGYCDFNSYAMRGGIVQRTVDAILAEIRGTPWRGRPAKTLFFGGGTPTFLSEKQLLDILDAVLDAHPAVDGAEITSEANPGTADAEKFLSMRRAGFNRISLGAQSFLDTDLKKLGRAHSALDIGASVDLARRAGFDNLSLDLMFALPGQTASAWKENLRRVIQLGTDHLSLYCLTLEPGTAFHRLHTAGRLTQPDDEAQVEMYDTCVEAMAIAGFAQYEISNFAAPGRECRHNLCYWHGEEYLAYGPGAVGCVGFDDATRDQRSEIGDRRSEIGDRVAGLDTKGPRAVGGPVRVRYTNRRRPSGYCSAIEEGGVLWEEQEVLDDATLRTERIMLGLRLNEGVVPEELSLDEGAMHGLEARSWVERSSGRLRLTPTGRHFCNDVAAELI